MLVRPVNNFRGFLKEKFSTAQTGHISGLLYGVFFLSLRYVFEEVRSIAGGRVAGAA